MPAEINIEFSNGQPFASGLPQELMWQVNGPGGRGGVRQNVNLVDHYASFKKKCFPQGGREEQIRAVFVTFMRTFLDPEAIRAATLRSSMNADFGGYSRQRLGSAPVDVEKELSDPKNCPKIETPGGSGSGGGTPQAQAPQAQKTLPRPKALDFSGPRLAGGRVGGIDGVRPVPGPYRDGYVYGDEPYPGVQPVQPVRAPSPAGPVQPVPPVKPAEKVGQDKPAGYRSKDKGPELPPVVIDRGGPTKPPPTARPGGQVVQAPPGRPQYIWSPTEAPPPAPVLTPPGTAPRPQAQTGFDTKAAVATGALVTLGAVAVTLGRTIAPYARQVLEHGRAAMPYVRMAGSYAMTAFAVGGMLIGG